MVPQSEPLFLQQFLGRCCRKDSRSFFHSVKVTGQKCKGKSQVSRALATDHPPQPDLQREMPTAVCWLLAGSPQVRRTGLLFLLSCLCRWAQILAWREKSLTGGISRTEEVAAGQAAQQHPSLGFCLLLKYLAHRRHKKDALFCYVCNDGFFFPPHRIQEFLPER